MTLDLNASIKDHPAFKSSSPYIKAVDFIGRTIQRTISGVDSDTFNRPGQEPQTKFILMFTSGEAVVLNTTNTNAMIAQHGELPSAWIGQIIYLATREYEIENKLTHGFVLHHPPEAAPDVDVTLPLQQGSGAPVAPLNVADGDVLPAQLHSTKVPGM